MYVVYVYLGFLLAPRQIQNQNERNMPFSCIFWRAIRREVTPSEFLESLKKEDCCQESGRAAKIASEINQLASGFSSP